MSRASAAALLAPMLVAACHPEPAEVQPALSALAIAAVQASGAGTHAFRGDQAQVGRLRIRAHQHGVEVSHADRGPGVKIAVEGAGRAGVHQRLDAVHRTVSDNRISIGQGDVTHWYVVGAAGLEHGSTFAQPPPSGDRPGELEVLVAIDGGRAWVDASGRSATIAAAVGGARFDYGNLLARDATGRVLPSRIRAHERGLVLAVDDRGAHYPVVVDPTVWLATEKTEAPTGSPLRFGSAIALDGTRLLVGAPGSAEADGTGAVHEYERMGGSWMHVRTIAPSQPQTGDDFGASLDLEGDRLIVGAPQPGGVGRAYVFDWDGSAWNEVTTLTPAQAHFTDPVFGTHVAVDGTRAIVVAPNQRVYGFHDDGQAWVEQLIPGAWQSAGGAAIEGNLAAVGEAYSLGEVRLFDWNGSAWQAGPVLTSTAGGGIGVDVLLSADRVVAGAQNWSQGTPPGSGAVVVWENGAMGWQEAQVLPNPDPVFLAYFGRALAWHGDRLAVGCPNNQGGSVYLFDHDGSDYGRSGRVVGTATIAGDSLGDAVALDANHMVMGAPLHAGDEAESGAVFGTGLLDIGQACPGDDACIELECVDGVCCDSACDDPCASCDTAGSEGQCLPRALGDPGTPACAPYLCDGIDTRCPTGCDSNDDCTADAYCGDGICRLKLDDGSPCADGAVCSSGLCVEAVCCNAACDGACESCALEGSQGTCSPRVSQAAGTPACAPFLCNGDDRACPASCADDAGCTSDHHCVDGACVEDVALGASCERGAQCSSEECVDAVCCSVADCGAYRCGPGGSCLTACENSADCGAAHECTSAGRCEPIATADVRSDCTLSGAPGPEGPRRAAWWIVAAALALAWRRRAGVVALMVLLAGCTPTRERLTEPQERVGTTQAAVIAASGPAIIPPGVIQSFVFGSSLAIGGDFLAVGSPGANGIPDMGRVDVLQFSGGAWSPIHFIEAPVAAGLGRFGTAVDIEANGAGATLLVGIPIESPTGTARIYTFDGTDWTPGPKLVAPDGVGGSMGNAVAIAGTHILLGAPSNSTAAPTAGRAYAFELSGGIWADVGELAPAGLADQDRFGQSVDISGDRAIVGTLNGDAVFFYLWNGTSWQPDGSFNEAGTGLGAAVAIDGDRAIAGQPAVSGGGARLYERVGGTWQEGEALRSAQPFATDAIGSAVALRGDFALVGSASLQGLATADGGAVLFRRTSGGTFTERAKLVPAELATAMSLGRAAGLHQNHAVLGAPNEGTNGPAAGAVFAFGVLDQGEACAAATDCVTGHCADGVCCDTPCDGTCASCAASGTEGICTADAMGSPGEPSCSPYVCDGQQMQCPTNCDAHADCDSNSVCVGGSCTSKLPIASVCTEDVECASDACSDGVCCDVACNGACESCSLPSLAGTCTPRPAGAAGVPSCTPATCDGTTTTCPDSCSDDDACVPGHHCADGTCRPPQPGGEACASAAWCETGLCTDGRCCLEADCGAYRCGDGGACRATCDNGSHCASGFECASDGNCIPIADVASPGACAWAHGRRSAGGWLWLAAVGMGLAWRRRR